MDIVAQIQEVNDIRKFVAPTISAFLPLLENNRAHILQIPKNSFKYGGTDRHQLDVYYPLDESSSNAKAPILFFIYGGGFTTGERTFPPPLDLGYTNLGSYFARRGFVTVIPDYRLAPNATFPGPAEDVRDAMKWIVDNAERLSLPGSPLLNNNSIFLMGHSAGAFHVSTMLLLPDILASTDLPPRIAGVILNGGPYRFNNITHGSLADVIAQYYGTLEEGQANDVYGLLERAPASTVDGLPKILLVEAEREPSVIADAGKDFQQSLEARTKSSVKKIIGVGHNHISPDWALGTGQGEKWAEEVTEWMLNGI